MNKNQLAKMIKNVYHWSLVKLQTIFCSIYVITALVKSSTIPYIYNYRFLKCRKQCVIVDGKQVDFIDVASGHLNSIIGPPGK